MKLLIQPGEGVAPLVQAIDAAESSIQIVIFRFDESEIERALAKAVDRGVRVEALIAHVNGSGEEKLRGLEQRLLADGVTVARTPDRLARYHGKYMVIDRRVLYLLSFNLTHHDIDFKRGFGLITENKELVEEAIKVFEADVQRKPYEAGSPKLIVSPVNARKELSAFIEGTQKELLIYDPKISDPGIVKLLEARLKEGVDIRIIGSVTKKSSKLSARAPGEMQLHTRTMIRDHKIAFIGSQSIRTMELDGRREVGAIVDDAPAVKRLAAVFESDWAEAGQPDETKPAAQVAKKVAKALAKELPPVAPVMESAIKEVAGQEPVKFDPEAVQETLKDAVKEAVKDAVRDVVEKAVEHEVSQKG